MSPVHTYGELWSGCQNEPFGPLRWLECHPGFISLISALATLAAVLVAICIPIFIDRRSKRDAELALRRRTRAALLPLASDLEAFRLQLTILRFFVRSESMTEVDATNFIARNTEHPLVVPQSFVESLGNVRTADREEVEMVRALTEVVGDYNELLEKLREVLNMPAHLDDETTEVFSRSWTIDKLLKSLLSLLSRAEGYATMADTAAKGLR